MISSIEDVVSISPDTDFIFSGVRSSDVIFPIFCTKALTAHCDDSCIPVCADPAPEPFPPPKSDDFFNLEVVIILLSLSSSLTAPLLKSQFSSSFTLEPSGSKTVKVSSEFSNSKG